MIQSTSGTSMPRAATSVQMRTEARWKGERKRTLWLAELLHRACPAFLDHSSVERENTSGLQARNVLQDGGKEVHGGAGEEEDDHLVGRVDLEKADELPLTETQRSYKAEFCVTRESDVVILQENGHCLHLVAILDLDLDFNRVAQARSNKRAHTLRLRRTEQSRSTLLRQLRENRSNRLRVSEVLHESKQPPIPATRRPHPE